MELGASSIVIACAGTAMALLLLIYAGARAQERDLRQLGCTCEHPRYEGHEARCPLARDESDEAGA